MSESMTLEQAKAKIAELEAEVKMVAMGKEAQALAAASAAASAAGKQPLLVSAFHRMSPQKRMAAMRSGDYQLVDDRDV